MSTLEEFPKPTKSRNILRVAIGNCVSEVMGNSETADRLVEGVPV